MRHIGSISSAATGRSRCPRITHPAQNKREACDEVGEIRMGITGTHGVSQVMDPFPGSWEDTVPSVIFGEDT